MLSTASLPGPALPGSALPGTALAQETDSSAAGSGTADDLAEPPADAATPPADGTAPAADGGAASPAQDVATPVPDYEFNADIFDLETEAARSQERIPDVTPPDQRDQLIEGLPGDRINAAYSDEALTPDSAIIVPPAPPPPGADVAVASPDEGIPGTTVLTPTPGAEMPAVPKPAVTPTGSGSPAAAPTGVPAEPMTAGVRPQAPAPSATAATPSPSAAPSTPSPTGFPTAPSSVATVPSPGLAPTGASVLGTPASRVPKVVADRAARTAGAPLSGQGTQAEPTVASEVGFDPAAPALPRPAAPATATANLSPTPADVSALEVDPASQMLSPDAAGVTATAITSAPATRSVLQRQSQQIAVIFFEHGSPGLNDRDRAVLADVVALQRQANGRLRVVGHASQWTAATSPLNQEIANYRVSLDRANAVAAELQRQGVGPGQIDVVARSDSQPLYWEYQPTGQAGNRRVEIYLEF